MNEIKVSLCITTFNRPNLCIESFIDVIGDERIDEIIIMDDAGTWYNYQTLVGLVRLVSFYNDKINLKCQITNRGMSVNKKDAISFARNPWCVLLDDDNKIGPDYLDALEATPDLFDDPSEIYLPDFAKPLFDYTDYSGIGFCSKNIKEVSGMKMFGALMNTCNYVVNRDFYLKTWQYNPEMKGTDTVWHSLQHLKAGGGFYVVPGMQYDHRMHADSGFAKDMDYNMAKAFEIEKQIKAL